MIRNFYMPLNNGEDSMSRIFPTILFILLIIGLSFSAFGALGQHPGGDEEEPEMKTETIKFNGYCSNPSSGGSSTWEDSAELDMGTVMMIEFSLTWTDDEGSGSDPDTLSFGAESEVHGKGSDQGSSGSLSFSMEGDELNGVWNLVVACTDAGSTPVGPLGFVVNEDPGNSWSMTVTYSYLEGEMSMEEMGMPPNVARVYASPIFWIHVALMIMSTYVFLFTGIFAGVFLAFRKKWSDSDSFLRKFTTTRLTLWLVVIAFIAFFLAAVPLGMYVAGLMYGWGNSWSGFPAIWHPDAFSATNADNVSLIVLILWAIPLYLNRRDIMRSKWFLKFFGWSGFFMDRARKAPEPRLTQQELMLCYFFMGFFVYLVFMVQPHGGGS